MEIDDEAAEMLAVFGEEDCARVGIYSVDGWVEATADYVAGGVGRGVIECIGLDALVVV